MKKKIWIIFGIIIAVILAGVFLVCGMRNAVPADDRPVVRIGASLPLTGNLAPVGGVIKEALLMAQAEIPADSKYRYELIIDDDQFEVKKTVANANKQISINKADAILTIYDSALRSVAPIAEKSKIPMIGCAWGKDFVKDYQYAFKHWPKPETQSKHFFQLLADKKIKSIAIINANVAAVQELMEQLEKDAKNKGVKIVLVEKINSGARDFRIEIEKIRKLGPDAVALEMFEPEMGIFVKQAREAGLNIPYVSVDQIYDANDKSALEGSEFVVSHDGSDEWKARLAQRTDLTILGGTANLYDAFKMLVDIYESADHKLTGAELKDRLYQTKDYPSALGMKVSVDKDGIIDSPLIRARISGGKVVKE